MAGPADTLIDDYEDIRPPREGRAVILAVGACLVFFLLWASFTQLDEVTRGAGRVIPSSSTQSVQSPDPGVVREILVRTGQSVERGEVLVRMDDTLTSADLGELEARSRALRARRARLSVIEAQGSEADFVCPEDIAADTPEVCATQRALLAADLENIADRVAIAEQRLEQRRRALSEARARIATYTDGVALAREQLDLVQPMVEANVLPRTELLEAERAANEQRGLLEAAREAAQGAQAAVREAEAELREIASNFRREALIELNEVGQEIAVIQETLRGAEDRVSRTEIRSPVTGTVNAIAVTTLGSYVNPGEEILSVVPRDDTLLIEARIRPSDIAFIRPGQEANIKVTAYDFAIYGGLDGVVTFVSSDSVYDAERDETYFLVQLETPVAYLERGGERFPISPGMVTQAEIITGRKSVMDYLLKPVTRAWSQALRER